MLILAFLCFCVACIFYVCGESGEYHADPTTGSKRQCVVCGQQQEVDIGKSPIGYIDIFGQRWWKVVGDIADPHCECHKDTIP